MEGQLWSEQVSGWWPRDHRVFAQMREPSCLPRASSSGGHLGDGSQSRLDLVCFVRQTKNRGKEEESETLGCRIQRSWTHWSCLGVPWREEKDGASPLNCWGWSNGCTRTSRGGFGCVSLGPPTGPRKKTASFLCFFVFHLYYFLHLEIDAEDIKYMQRKTRNF